MTEQRRTPDASAGTRTASIGRQRVVSGKRLGILNELPVLRNYYDNRDVPIPLYESLRPDQLTLRLPISLGIPKQVVDDSADALFGEGRFGGVKMVGRD